MTFFSNDTMRLYHAHVSTKFETNRSKTMVAIAKNVFWSLPIASQHQNSKIWLHHYTRPSHTYHVSKYEEDRGSVEKQRSLNIYKFGGRGGGGGGRQPRDLL